MEYSMLPTIAVGRKDQSYGPKFNVKTMVAAYNKTAEDLSVFELKTVTFSESATWNSTIHQQGNALMMTIAEGTPDNTGAGDSTTTASNVIYQTFNT